MPLRLKIRDVILPEDVPRVDEQYRRALQLAAQTYRLDELQKTLRLWRLNAWQVSAEGPDAWRALLAKAERVLAPGELPPHSVSADQIRELLGERQRRKPAGQRYGSTAVVPADRGRIRLIPVLPPGCGSGSVARHG